LNIFVNKTGKMAKFSEIVSGDTPVLVDFSAEWCGPCKMMEPILKEVKKKSGDSIKIIKIDTDRNPALATRYQIRGVPTLILFKNGRVVWRQSGVIPANELIAVLQNYF
jgi:thioredoxin 1